jgi:glycosyltransferase involved in cell wall biosynthesis
VNCSILIPAFNEAEGIAEVLRALREHVPGAEIVVIDDGSTDGTAEAVREAGGEAVRLVRHEENRGYGAALKTGIRNARSDLIVIVDADGTYPVERIPDLVAMAEEADMVVGARTAKGAAIPLVRRPAKWALRKLANYLARRRIPDLNSGLRVMRRTALEPFLGLLPDGFSFTTTITLAMLVNGYRVRFEPIDYRPRRGRSKIRPIRDTANFIQLILRTVVYFEPLRVFGPVSALLFLASLGTLLVGWLGFGTILDGTIVALFLAGLQFLGIGLVADLVNQRLKK